MRDGDSNAGTDTGQDYFNARYFWANTARFTSPDAPFADQRPEDGQSWNMYAYVRNNPLRYVDFMGRECVDGVSVNMENDEDNGKFCFVTDATSTPITTTQDTTSSATEDEQVSVDDSIMALLPTRDVPIYGLMGEGSLVLAVAGRQATHDAGCVIPFMGFGATGAAASATGESVWEASQDLLGKQKARGMGGSTEYTSRAAEWSRSNLPRWKVRLPAPTGDPRNGTLRWRVSPDVASAAGRYAPYVGQGLKWGGRLAIPLGAAGTWACLSSR